MDAPPEDALPDLPEPVEPPEVQGPPSWEGKYEWEEGREVTTVPDRVPVDRPAYRPKDYDPDDRPARLADEDRELIDEVEAQHILTLVNKDRIALLRRLRRIILFPETVRGHDRARARPKVNDPPQIQLLFLLRDELDGMPRDEYKDRALRLQLLNQLTSAVNAVTSEASKASVEVQKLMTESARMRQKQQEHEDKMALARDNARGGWDDDELAEIAGQDVP